VRDRRRRPRLGIIGLALATALVALSAGGSAPAAGAPNDDPRSERDRVRRQRAEVAAQVDALEANQADVSAALATLNANVAVEEARLADAQRAAAQARAAADAATTAAAAALSELDAMEAQVRTVAIEAYMEAGTAREAELLLESDDLTEAIERRELLQHRQGSQADAIDRLRAAREDAEIARQDAEAASERAAEQQAAVERQLTSLQAARDQRQTMLDGVEARLDASLAEAAALASLDSRLSQQIAQQEAALAARARAAGSGGGGRIHVSAGNVSVVSVRGIVVNVQIADELEAMLALAASQGHGFGGGGYRSPEAQWRLREAHCPDPANSPPSACSPPTARPGSSQHELGLAIDFTYNGRLISSRGNPGFAWLAANANRFGFYNLPSEPWHWSVNGN
jgi:hypothetical protein